MTDLLLGERRAAARRILDAAAKLLAEAEAHHLVEPVHILRWTTERLETYVADAGAERKARAIGDPNCPAGYR